QGGGRGCRRPAGRRSGADYGALRAARRVDSGDARRNGAVAGRPRAARPRRARRGARRRAPGAGVKVSGALFLATLFVVTWEKVYWNVAGAVGIADVLTILFLIAFAFEWGAPRFPRTTAVVLGFFGVLLVIYLVGFFNIETKQSLDQWGKGMVKFVLHFLFLAAGVAFLARRPIGFYWRALAAFTLGLVGNSAYGALQLLAAHAGVNLDNRVLAPLTGGARSLHISRPLPGRRPCRAPPPPRPTHTPPRAGTAPLSQP